MKKYGVAQSNGDINTIVLEVENQYNFTTHLKIIDELPFQFQHHDFEFNTSLKAGKNKLMLTLGISFSMRTKRKYL